MDKSAQKYNYQNTDYRVFVRNFKKKYLYKIDGDRSHLM